MMGLNSKSLIFLGFFCLTASTNLVRLQSTDDPTAKTDFPNPENGNATLTRHRRSVTLTPVFRIRNPPPSLMAPSNKVVRAQVRNFGHVPVKVLCKAIGSNAVVANSITIDSLFAMAFICPVIEIPSTAFACEATFIQKVLSANVKKSLSFSVFGKAVGTAQKPNKAIDIYADKISYSNY